MKKIIIVSIIVTFFSSCLFMFDRISIIKILNKSNYTIYAYDSFFDSLSIYQTDFSGNSFRTSLDTSYYIFSNGAFSYSSNRAEPDSMAYLSFSGTRKGIFRDNLCVDGKIRFFIFKEETIRKYSWETICKYQMYEKKLTFTEDELKENDWVVVYE